MDLLPKWTSTNFCLQILILKQHQIFQISYFHQFHQAFKKTIYPEIYPKIIKNFAKKPKTQLCGMSKEIFDCLKRERDISVSTTMILPSQNMAFMLTPSLIQILLADTLKTPRSSCHFVNEGTLLRYSLSYLSQNRQIEKPSQINTSINQPPFQITLPFLPILWTTQNSFPQNSSPQIEIRIKAREASPREKPLNPLVEQA